MVVGELSRTAMNNESWRREFFWSFRQPFHPLACVPDRNLHATSHARSTLLVRKANQSNSAWKNCGCAVISILTDHHRRSSHLATSKRQCIDPRLSHVIRSVARCLCRRTALAPPCRQRVSAKTFLNGTSRLDAAGSRPATRGRPLNPHKFQIARNN